MAIACTIIGMIALIGTVFSIMLWCDLRSERKAGDPALKLLQEQVAQQAAKIDALTDALSGLRSALVVMGAAERPAALPPPPTIEVEEEDECSPPPPNQANSIFVKKPADRPSHVESRQPGELVGIEVPRASEERGIPLERQAEYTAEELAAADAYAAEKGITRDQALWELVQTGAAKIQASRESGEHLTKRRPTPTPSSTPATVGHCFGPHCVDGSSSCTCTCPGCSGARFPLG